MTNSFFRPALRIVAVAVSAVVAGIYVYDRAGGDLFGLRAAESTPASHVEAQNEPLGDEQPRTPDNIPHQTHQPTGDLAPMPAWYTGSAVLADPFPFIDQRADVSSPQAPNAPPNAPSFSEPPKQPTILPGSKFGAVAVPWIESQP